MRVGFDLPEEPVDLGHLGGASGEEAYDGIWLLLVGVVLEGAPGAESAEVVEVVEEPTPGGQRPAITGVVWPSWSTKRSTPSDSPSELEHRLGHAGGRPAGHPGQLGHRRPDVQVGQAGPTSDEGGFETAVGERMGAAGSEKTAVTADATRAGSAEVSRAGGTRHRTLRAKSIRGPG